MFLNFWLNFILQNVNRCTHCTPTWFLPASTHLRGQLYAPLLSQRSHTHSAKPQSSLSAPASLSPPTVPPSTGLLPPCESRAAPSFSCLFLSAPPALVTLFILRPRTQFESPSLHQSHATRLRPAYLLEYPFLQRIRAS